MFYKFYMYLLLDKVTNALLQPVNYILYYKCFINVIIYRT